MRKKSKPTKKLLRNRLERVYYRAAREYQRKLPLEHYAERTSQASQRFITLSSLSLLKVRRPEVQVFSELLVQYPRIGRKLGQLVPDNMVVVHAEPIHADLSYDLPRQSIGPFMMLDFVSKETTRKDYRDNMCQYQDGLNVPYYLLFDPEEKKLTLFRHTGAAFATDGADEHGRLAVKELDLAVAVLDGWARFWYQGELLPLPAELQKSLDDTRTERDEASKRLAAAEGEISRLRAQIQL